MCDSDARVSALTSQLRSRDVGMREADARAREAVQRARASEAAAGRYEHAIRALGVQLSTAGAERGKLAATLNASLLQLSTAQACRPPQPGSGPASRSRLDLPTYVPRHVADGATWQGGAHPADRCTCPQRDASGRAAAARARRWRHTGQLVCSAVCWPVARSAVLCSCGCLNSRTHSLSRTIVQPTSHRYTRRCTEAAAAAAAAAAGARPRRAWAPSPHRRAGRGARRMTKG